MAEPLKHLLDRRGIEAAAAVLARVWPAFPAAAFVMQACAGLETLELKARAMQIATALEAALPPAFGDAAAVIAAALAPPARDERTGQLGTSEAGLAGWMLWPVGEFVARRGLDEPGRALRVLHALTQRFSAEFAIRPFIARHPELTFATLAHWCDDASEHVRRLVSEGSRPRLPWGMRLQSLVADPAPTLPLLLALQDDDSDYVRRSVANHLNDIAKDHPDVVAAWLEAHLPDAGAARRALLRHASRTLIKQGHPRVLAAWGLDKPFRGEAALRVAPRTLTVGDALRIELALVSGAARRQRLVIDYAVHHVKADGRTTPKVFKGWVVELAAGQTLALAKAHSMRAVTTRRYHAGRHLLDVRINGRVAAACDFTLRLPG